MTFPRRTPRLPALVVAVVVIACGADSAEWQGTVTDSAGIQIVMNPETGVWRGDGGWTVEQELIIGSAAGQPEYQFGQISGLDVGPDGRIYVIDQQAREVRVFGPDGEFIRTMGQAGSGPGELSQAAGPIFIAAGDTVVVPDMMQQRITLYTGDGEPAGSRPLPMTGGIAVKWMEAPDHDLIQQAMVMAFPGQEDVEQKNLLVRREPTGEVIDTLFEMSIGRSVSFSGNTPSITMFESEPMWTVGPDGRLYTGVNSDYSLEVRSPEGELSRIVRKPFERRPIIEGDRAEIRRIVRGLWEDQGMPPQALEMMSNALEFADFYPAYANIMGGPAGTLWVQRIQTPEQIREAGGTFDIQDLGSATWEIFSDEGRLLGTLEMPPRFTPMMFSGDDALYGIARDELDVQYVARMRLNRGPEAQG